MVLIDSEPEIWRLLGLRGPLALSHVHRVLQAALAGRSHLHRFVTSGPFVPPQPVDGDFPEVLQWLAGQECEEPDDRPEEDCCLDQLLSLGSGGTFSEYDFGDSWLHRLELISRPARLMEGTRRGPLGRLGRFSRIRGGHGCLGDPSYLDHAEHAAWVAGITGFDAPLTLPSSTSPL